LKIVIRWFREEEHRFFMEIRRDEDDEFLSSSRVAGETGGKTISWRFKNDIFAGGD
jgi:hypothetical protein